VVYEKDFNEVKFEELKKIVKDLVNKKKMTFRTAKKLSIKKWKYIDQIDSQIVNNGGSSEGLEFSVPEVHDLLAK